MKHYQSMTRESLSATADDTIEASTDDGELTVFFRVTGEWVDGSWPYWDADYSVIGVVHDLAEGGSEIFTEDEAYARFGFETMRDLTEMAIERAE